VTECRRPRRRLAVAPGRRPGPPWTRYAPGGWLGQPGIRDARASGTRVPVGGRKSVLTAARPAEPSWRRSAHGQNGRPRHQRRGHGCHRASRHRRDRARSGRPRQLRRPGWRDQTSRHPPGCRPASRCRPARRTIRRLTSRQRSSGRRHADPHPARCPAAIDASSGCPGPRSDLPPRLGQSRQPVAAPARGRPRRGRPTSRRRAGPDGTGSATLQLVGRAGRQAAGDRPASSALLPPHRMPRKLRARGLSSGARPSSGLPPNDGMHFRVPQPVADSPVTLLQGGWPAPS
jgi:hypothetical protein